jgi:hypothetical protein
MDKASLLTIDAGHIERATVDPVQSEREVSLPRQRRNFRRYEIQYPARILIGTRQYAGLLQNISPGGARLRTMTPIRKTRKVLLRLPDLPPLPFQLRWTHSYSAGVAFELIPRKQSSGDGGTRCGSVDGAFCEGMETTS